ncbi:hypothetical protein K7432_007273 [Basidiobolus ranarum]|uniref:Uncharacterized protein n=1 Tax=Basidiobolus ranarum TaxID=34480 RepID=A0ABR2W0C0_9FUNG
MSSGRNKVFGRPQSFSAFDFSYSPMYTVPDYKTLGIPRVTTDNWSERLNSSHPGLTVPKKSSGDGQSLPFVNTLTKSTTSSRNWNMEKQWRDTTSLNPKSKNNKNNTGSILRKSRKPKWLSRFLHKSKSIRKRPRTKLNLSLETDKIKASRFNWSRLFTWITFVGSESNDITALYRPSTKTKTRCSLLFTPFRLFRCLKPKLATPV